jgi:hypothetical protein
MIERKFLKEEAIFMKSKILKLKNKKQRPSHLVSPVRERYKRQFNCQER